MVHYCGLNTDKTVELIADENEKSGSYTVYFYSFLRNPKSEWQPFVHEQKHNEEQFYSRVKYWTI